MGLLLASSGGDAESSTVAANGASGEVSELAVEYFDGTTGSLGDYDGQPLVVNFFASWCGPCLRELPGFEQVHQASGGEVGFLGVNLQDSDEAGIAVAESTGITYDLARDRDGRLFSDLGAFAMPTTLFIDAGGNIVETVSGEISAQGLADKIDQHFGS